jgi:predicted nucleic acid-binding protein
VRSIAILDAGPLLASFDRDDLNHAAADALIARRDLRLVIPTLVVAEVAHLAGGRLGPRHEAVFVRSLAAFEVEAPTVDEWPLIADLVERYADFPLGTTDAATIVLADRLETDLIATLDRRHFAVVRSPKGRRFRLLPETIAVQEDPMPYDADTA